MASSPEKNKMDKKQLKIKITKNGPYTVSGNVPLIQEAIVTDQDGTSVSWEKTSEFPTQESYSLCRCGHTKTPPFCDGSHLKAGFDGSETASRKPYLEQAERFEGPELVLTDAYDLCASARFCDRAGSIWNLIQKEDKESIKIAKQEAADCSSGRLVVYDKKTGKALEPKFKPSISITEDPAAGVSGPLWVKGDIEIESSNGHIYEKRNRVTLCRCGHSENKPFCDTLHISSGFNDGDKNLNSI